ncbi:hypothetical protein BGZ93_003446, partial [Podila epicladia]
MAKKLTTTSEKHSPSPSAEQAAAELPGNADDLPQTKAAKAEVEAVVDVKKEPDTEASTNKEATKEPEIN